MIDTHTHLTDARFENDLPEVIQRAREAGVEKMVCPTTNIADLRRALEIAKNYHGVYVLAGIYPGEAGETSWREEVRAIQELVEESGRVVGIGEIGLDRESYQERSEIEEAVFRAQIELALKLQMPVVVHTRETEVPMRKILETYSVLPRGHFHCFSGSHDWLSYVLSRGFYVGFDGNVTYKNAENLRELARMVPRERLLLETDSPYLPPEGKRGERNESANVRMTAQFLATLRGESLELLIESTTKNARELFGI